MMLSEITVGKKNGGITAKEISDFTQRAMQFSSEIYIESGMKKVNAKSIMGVISLCIKDGSKIVLVAKGDDEEAAVTALKQLLSGL